MLNPCNPCVCPSASCDQCAFGYKSNVDKHEMMKKLIEAVNNGEKPNGHVCAERYMKLHNDWRSEEMEDIVSIVSTDQKD